ncbi:SOUL family heme-binding protein [Sulfuriflexus mobilis]|uniref:SOUL family heme-binding protein n=1 Tax=Sulfuriflexus mobilis TaxID=1811807 RepID=UPI001E598EF0|nr:heme-binding protein [Sulfuriflexus mobilis]
MKIIRVILAFTAMLVGGGDAMAIEEAKYTVVEKEDIFEIRDYAPHVLAETIVEGSLEDAGNKAFNRLFQYISGNNQTRNKVAMTAPVSQESTGIKIDMTAPVGQQQAGERWAVSFMMPAAYTLETLPKPLDPTVRLRQVPARRMAAIRYSGFWSEEGYLRNKAALVSWIENKGLKAVGEPIWARYNAPFSLWFLRRNEVLISIGN